ncbi:MAG: hypothetical protein QGD94_09085, partial [Planctomycetia bacterium]|nr:hypothetical protein [Planctomycetia bacterium]
MPGQNTASRYRISRRAYLFSFLVHLVLLGLFLIIQVRVIKPPPPTIELQLSKGAKLLDSQAAAEKMNVLMEQLSEAERLAEEAEAAQKALREAIGAAALQRLQEFADDPEIGGDTDPGFDYGESFEAAQELVEMGKDASEQLLDALDNLEDDFKARRRAAKVLAMAKEERAIPAIVEGFLRDHDPASWGIMLSMNKFVQDDPKHAKIIGAELLRASKDPKQMAKMAGRWLFVNPKSVGGRENYEKQIQRFLIDGDTATRNAFFNMAQHYGPLNKRSQRVLARLMLKVPDDKIRARAAEALGVSGRGIEVIAELRRALKNDKSVIVRAAALGALNSSAAEDKVAINIEATKDSAAVIRRRATLSLKWGSLPSRNREEAIRALRRLIDDEDITVRQYALVGLGRHRVVDAFPDIMKSLEDEEGKIQMSAMTAVSHLVSAMDLDKDAAEMVLEFASKDKMGADGKQVGKGHWLHGGGVVTRWAAMTIATHHAPRQRAIEMLISQLKQPELRTRGRALGLLVQLRATEAVDHIAKLLGHPS